MAFVSTTVHLIHDYGGQIARLSLNQEIGELNEVLGNKGSMVSNEAPIICSFSLLALGLIDEEPRPGVYT